MKMISKCKFPVKIGKKNFEHSFYVIKKLMHELILGFDLIQEHRLNYNTETKTFKRKK